MGIIWSRCAKTIRTQLVKLVPAELQEHFPDGISLGIILDQLIYHPEYERDVIVSPLVHFIPKQFEEIYITTSDNIRLHSYLLKQSQSYAYPTFLWFHGNAGTITHRLDLAKQFYKMLPCNVLLVEYRGYGFSEGTPSESGFYKDAKAGFLYIEKRLDLDSKKIILFGRSLGGAVAIDLASRWNFRELVYALIVENTFTSIPDVAKHILPGPLSTYLPVMFYNSQYISKKKISKVVCPTLFLSGQADEFIPRQMMSQLYANCTSSYKDLAEIAGGTHNDTFMCRSYIPHIRRFLVQVAKRRQE